MRSRPLRFHAAPFAALLVGSLLAASTVAAQQDGMKDMSTFPNPLERADNVWIEELTMLEVRDLLDEGTNRALILTGGIEENGPYLTTGKHNHVLKVMGESIARRLGRTLVAPIVTIEPGRPRAGLHAGGHPVLPGDVPGGLERHGHEPEGSGLHGHLPSGGQRRESAGDAGRGR